MERAVSKCGGRGGGRGWSRNGNGRGQARSVGNKRDLPKKDEEEPLSKDPEIIVDEEDKKGEEENVKKEEPKVRREQTARHGKAFNKNIRKMEDLKKCSVNIKREDLEFLRKEEKKKGTDNESGCEVSDRIIGEDGKKEEEKITEDKNKNMQNDEVEITSSEHANINNVGGEEIVTADNVIHDLTVQDEDDKKVKEEPKIANMKGHHVETVSVYVNNDQITGNLEYTEETENEKQVRLAIIGNSLEISKIEDEIHAELIKMVKVEDSEERIKRLKEVLELLQGYTMSMNRIKNNGNETEQKSS